jgi:hypothetical protein
MEEQKTENEVLAEVTEEAKQAAEQELDPNAQAAQDTLKALESTVPAGVVAGKRQEIRDIKVQTAEQLEAERTARFEAEVEKARLEGKLEALQEAGIAAQQQQQEQKEPEKSPRDKYLEEIDDPGAFIPANVQIEQENWEKTQQQQQTQQAQLQQAIANVNESLAKAKTTMTDGVLGQGLGLESVVGLAKQHGLITEADNNYAASHGKAAAATLYQIAVNKIQRAGGQPMQELTKRIQLKKANPSQKTNVNPQQTNLQDTDEDTGVSDHARDLTNFIAGGGQG